MALISIKDVKQAIAVMRQILEKLDEIYHVLHDKQWMNDEWPGKENKQMKSWNVRDQTENELRFQEEKLYKNIEAKYRLIKKVSKIEELYLYWNYYYNIRSITLFDFLSKSTLDAEFEKIVRNWLLICIFENQ